MKTTILCCLLSALALLSPARAWAKQETHPKTIILTDDRGHTLNLAQPPQRIVTLLPSLTESICALGQCNRLVGVDRYSDWPTSVQRLPQVGGGLDPSVEAIVALRPDIVLLPLKSRASDRLEALGIHVMALSAKNHADVRRVLRLLGDMLAVPHAQGADRVWSDIDAALTTTARALPAAAHGARVYFETSRGPWSAGPQSFIGEILARLGMRNIVPQELGLFPRLNPEFVLRAQPDIIMLTQPGDTLPGADYPGWEHLKAMQQGRVCAFNQAETNVLLRPGPRMNEAVHVIAQCLVKVFRSKD